MVDVIAQHSLRLVQQTSRLFRIAYFVNDLLEKIGIVSSCCLDEELGERCTLQIGQKCTSEDLQKLRSRTESGRQVEEMERAALII